MITYIIPYKNNDIRAQQETVKGKARVLVSRNARENVELLYSIFVLIMTNGGQLKQCPTHTLLENKNNKTSLMSYNRKQSHNST